MGIFNIFNRKKILSKEDIKNDGEKTLDELNISLNSIETDFTENLNEVSNHKKFTPNRIESLSFNEVFVFGSNLEGHHNSGAAKLALDKFGAIYGKGVGLQGQTYAIPTMHGDIETIIPYVNDFIDFAIKNCDRFYYVTRIGCGIAGFKDEQIAPLFAKALNSGHIYLPKSFVDFLNNTQDPDILNELNKTIKDEHENHMLEYSFGYLKFNNDFNYIQDACPGYLNELTVFENELNTIHNCHLGMRFTDNHYSSRLHFWIQKSGDSLYDNDIISDLKKKLDRFEDTLNITCSQCGSQKNVSFRDKLYHWNSHYVNQMYLCDECFNNYNKEEFSISVSSNLYFLNNRNLNKVHIENNRHFVRKDIRFINSLNEFDYAKFGYFFFDKDDVYILSDNPRYKELDLKNTITNTVYTPFRKPNYYEIKGLYAGHDTGFKDDFNKKIYTGDIVRVKGAHSNERDPFKYFEKNRLDSSNNKNLFEVVGIVTSSPECSNTYQVILFYDGWVPLGQSQYHSFFLCHASELELMGNIMFNLEPNKRIDISGAAYSTARQGALNITNIKNIREDLMNIKTPSFKSTEELTET
jgi:hypothetical protein